MKDIDTTYHVNTHYSTTPELPKKKKRGRGYTKALCKKAKSKRRCL